MSVKVEVITATDTAFADGQTPIVVLADMDVETISVGEVGPPGPPGQPGQPGPPGIPGNTILYAARDPVPADGNNGDSWINSTTWFFFGPKMNHAWPAGVDMIGATILSGTADPIAGQGADGDFHINTATHMFFGPKAAGAWPAGVSMIGPQGPQGIQGIPGNTVLYGAANPIAGQGVDGDFYINTTTHFLFGPKAAGAWPAGTSLVGPQGIQGPVGPTGPVPEAPTDGKLYGRQNSAWAEAGTFPAGTVMLFYQAAAPLGWTKITTQNDKALRVVSGAGGVAGGTNPFSTVMAQTAVGNHTLSLTETPAGITAGWNANLTVYPAGSSTINLAGINGGTWYQLGILSSATATVPPGYNIAYSNTTIAPDGFTAMQGINAATATSNNTGGGAHNHPITMAIQYVDVILASKN
ncbi:hypothetical protein [Bradyrhizobium sp. S3.9.1]|uniref:hypothetical protein n=1 Tax=Bradyrhizobium sp. S3.9.1 TaxID=3156431 RepID=UPI0033964CA6